jgi:predicted DCC family thiol-disulfide oxidoreductase YuxK
MRSLGSLPVARNLPREKTRIYYDGQCAMCTAVMSQVRASQQGGEFQLCDMHADPAMPFEKTAVAREMHLVDAEGRVYRGAAAILEILGRYPRWAFVAWIGRSPLIKPLLPLGYALIAANRRFLFGAMSRIFWLKATVLIAFALGLLISLPLWIGPRSYPLAPLLGLLPPLVHPFDQALVAALFASMAAALLSPRPRKFIAAALAIVVLFCLLDQTRWQPWVYLYCALSVTLALFSWDSGDDNGRRKALNVARLIIVATYFFSGLQKLNWNFVAYEFPGLVQPILDRFPDLSGAVHVAALMAPFIQIGFAIGLLTQRFRRISLIVAVAMHVFILAMLGPFGQNWNVVVWPWTAAMALIDILLFRTGEPFRWRDIVPRRPGRWQAAALVLFAIMPLFSFVNIWDSYLSAALYSGNLTEATIYLSDTAVQALPANTQRYLEHTSDNTNVLNVQRWAIEDLGVTPYPEARVYQAIARDLCASMPNVRQLVLIVHEQRMFFSGPETGYRCDQL